MACEKIAGLGGGSAYFAISAIGGSGHLPQFK